MQKKNGNKIIFRVEFILTLFFLKKVLEIIIINNFLIINK